MIASFGGSRRLIGPGGRFTARLVTRVGSHVWAAAALVTALGVLAVVDLSDSARATMCPWRQCTGVSCPGCGMTRAVSRLLHGDVGGAIRYHPLVFMVLAEIVALIGAMWVWARRGRRMSIRWINVIIVVNIVVLVSVWVVRALTGSLPV